MQEIWQLFWMFFRIGSFTFGGGYAMLPILQRELAEEKKWLSPEELIDFYAIGQSTPGIIAVNTATLVGYKRKGIAGAIFATAGMVAPSLIIISLIASVLQRFQEYALVQHAFAGIQIAVIALILDTVIKMGKTGIRDYTGLVIFILAFLLLSFLGISPIIVIVSSALVGILMQNRQKNRMTETNYSTDGDKK